MGWVANEPGNGEKDRFPVETMVNAMHAHIADLGDACVAYNGQSRRCCDGIKICFEFLEDAFNLVRIQAIGNQNMYIACRSLKSELSATDSCVETWEGKCHWSVDKNDVLQPFQEALTAIHALRGDFCDNLPPERTTVVIPTTRSSSTTSVTVSSTVTTATTVSTTVLSKTTTQSNNVATSQSYTSPHKPPTTFNPPITQSTEAPQETTEVIDPTTTPLTSKSTFIPSTTTSPILNGSDVGQLDDMTSLSSDDDTSMIVGSVAGGFLLIIFVIVGIVFMRRRNGQKNDDAGSSNDSRSVTAYLSKWFQSNKGHRPGTNETEIYAEIDDAFMEAVYGIDRVQKKQPKIRDRVFSHFQVNMCYENSTDSGVILSKPPLPVANSEPTLLKGRQVGFTVNSRSPSSVSPAGNKDGQVFFGPSFDSGSQKDVNLSPSRKGNSNCSSPSHRNGSKVSPSYVPGRPDRLAYFRKEDDMVTSFQANCINQSNSQLPSDDRTVSRELVVSRPSFTSIRDEPVCANKSDTGEYTSIVDTSDSSPEEPIYAEPENQYDSANYGHIAPVVVIKEMKRAKSNDYASLRQFVLPKRFSAAFDPPNSDYNSVIDDFPQSSGPHYEVPEYVKANDIKKKKGDRKKDKGKKDENPVYENVDTMMVY